jgi:hypothetical protein
VTLRLYVVTRDDLDPCHQAVQAVHAALDWALAHPDLHGAWARASNTLALLAVRDEATLFDLARRARRRALPMMEFREPDRGHELTAICLGAGEEAERLCARLRPALGAPPAPDAEAVDTGPGPG